LKRDVNNLDSYLAVTAGLRFGPVKKMILLWKKDPLVLEVEIDRSYLW
jgi:hypothetical protein